MGDDKDPPYDYHRWHRIVVSYVYRNISWALYHAHHHDVEQEIHFKLSRVKTELSTSLAYLICERTLIDYVRKHGRYARSGLENINNLQNVKSWDRINTKDHWEQGSLAVVPYLPQSALPTTEDVYFRNDIPKIGFSKRQQQVAFLLGMGFNTAEIARLLKISEARVFHIRKRLARNVASNRKRS